MATQKRNLEKLISNRGKICSMPVTSRCEIVVSGESHVFVFISKFSIHIVVVPGYNVTLFMVDPIIFLQMIFILCETRECSDISYSFLFHCITHVQ